MLLSWSGDRRNPGHARSVSDNTHPRSGDLDVAERRRPVGCLSEAIKARDRPLRHWPPFTNSHPSWVSHEWRQHGSQTAAGLPPIRRTRSPAAARAKRPAFMEPREQRPPAPPDRRSRPSRGYHCVVGKSPNGSRQAEHSALGLSKTASGTAARRTDRNRSPATSPATSSSTVKSVCSMAVP